MSFSKNGYLIVKEAFAPELMNFCNYILKIRRNTQYILNKNPEFVNTTSQMKSIEMSLWLGTFKDWQAPNIFSVYGDPAMETLLLMAHPLIEDKIKLKLLPCYAYARIYEKGSELKKHRDRFSCEISCTLNIGGDLWPIHLKNKNKKIKVNLKPGDLLIYKGVELEHWRNKFTKNECTQVFLHYVNKDGKYSHNFLDSRPALGMPKQKKIS